MIRPHLKKKKKSGQAVALLLRIQFGAILPIRPEIINASRSVGNFKQMHYYMYTCDNVFLFSFSTVCIYGVYTTYLPIN